MEQVYSIFYPITYLAKSWNMNCLGGYVYFLKAEGTDIDITL